MVKEDHNSVTYLALCGAPIEGYSDRLVNEALGNLRGYYKKCVDRGYLDESAFIDQTISEIKAGVKAKKEAQERDTVESISAELEDVQRERDEEDATW
jgi:hypothetical protein